MFALWGAGVVPLPRSPISTIIFFQTGLTNRLQGVIIYIVKRGYVLHLISKSDIL
jgi:hypothetical protein